MALITGPNKYPVFCSIRLVDTWQGAAPARRPLEEVGAHAEAEAGRGQVARARQQRHGVAQLQARRAAQPQRHARATRHARQRQLLQGLWGDGSGGGGVNVIYSLKKLIILHS